MKFCVICFFFIVLTFNYNNSLAFIPKKNINLTSPFVKINSNIGVVDFRNILKKSKTMKKVGSEFLKFEKIINQKIKNDEKKIRIEEKDLLNVKNKIAKDEFDKRKKLIKQKITNLQKYSISEKNKLKSSFQNIQKKLNDVLAQIIKDIATKKNIDVVLLRENVFLYNKKTPNLSSEALEAFDKRTKDLKITTVKSN